MPRCLIELRSSDDSIGVVGLGGGGAVLDDILPFLSLPGASWRFALQLLYVVYQGKQLPLCIHLASGSEREAA